MTELETVIRAKMYIDKMANGLDPLSDTPVPENDTLNQVRISRCLFYVSGILEKVVANGGYVGAKPKIVKPEFLLTEQEAASFRFSERPIPVSEIAARLNELKSEENMKDIPAARIASWLVSVGMLEVYVNREGGKRKRPTETGAKMGLSLEHRTGQYGEYDVVIYDITAQRFLIDHLDAVASFRAKKEDVPGDRDGAAQ